MTNKKKPADKPLSLAHLTPEQAIFKALTTPLPKKKPAARKKLGKKKA